MIIFGINLSTADLWLLGLCGSLFMVIIVYRLNQSSKKKDAFIVASRIFSSKVRAELKGIYPTIELHLPTNEINRIIIQSIPGIQLAVNDFKAFVPFFQKSDFDIAVNNYYEIARNTNWNNQIAHQLYPKMQKVGNHSPKEMFVGAAYKLLSYAKEN